MTQSSAFAAPIYSLTDLGTLGGTTGFGTALNDHGHATGYSTLVGGETRGFYWTPGGGMQDLGIIGTGMSQGFDISNNNHIVGQTGGKAFRWTPGTGMVLIDGANNGSANGLNNNDEAIGARTLTTSSRTLKWDSADSITNPFPVTNSQGIAMNDLGQFVSTAPGGAFYSPGSATFTNLAAGFTPTDLNNNREIVGSLGGIAALLDFDTNTTTLLGKLSPTDTFSQALGISQTGTIVGVSQGTGAFILDSTMSSITSLTSLLDPAYSGWTILSATDVSNNGMIIGYGQFNNGDIRPIILTLVPEPNTIALCGLALVGFVGFAIRSTARRSGQQRTS